MSGLFWKMTITNSIATSYWVFTHLYIHLAAPWRRMPVVLKEDLGLSSLGLTGSRGMLQYGVAFMKIISRRSNDRLFDNPIRGETTSMTYQLLRIQTLNQTKICGYWLGWAFNIWLYLLEVLQKCLIFNLFNFLFNTFFLHFTTCARDVTGYLKLGEQVVMRCATAPQWHLLFWQK